MWEMRGLVKPHILLHFQTSCPYPKDHPEGSHCNQKSLDQNLCSTVAEESLQESANQNIDYKGTGLLEREFEKVHENKE